MSDYTYRRIITDREGVSTIVKEVNVPDEVVKQIRADAFDDLMNKLCNHCMKQTNRCNKLECPFGKGGCGIINITAQLKEQNK